MAEPVAQDDDRRPLRVAILGAGPSAFYAAEALFKSDAVRAQVDMFDRLPTPYGLVRGGVAPDHQKIKNVVRVYEKIAAHPDFRFFGNVMLGRDVSVDDLRGHYDQWIYAVGNESDRRMGLPGEDLEGVHSATEFVGWYNGHPDHRDRRFGLRRSKRVAVVGHGNVAIDVARLLSRHPDELAQTDIAGYALEILHASLVDEIALLGRRGPAQAAFSPKEIKELAECEGVDLVVAPESAVLDPLSEQWLESQARSAKRTVSYLQERAAEGPADEGVRRRVDCRFLVSPTEFLGDEEGHVRAVRVEHAELRLDDHGTPRPHGTGVFEDVPADIVFKAVGYRGVPIEGVPFRDDWGTIPNEEGRVLTRAAGDVVPGEYVVGWAKRGPTGLVGTNSPDSKETVARMLQDAQSLPKAMAVDADDIVRMLADRQVEVVTLADWQRLDAYEVERGQLAGRPRQKLTSVDEMLQVVRELRAKSS